MNDDRIKQKQEELTRHTVVQKTLALLERHLPKDLAYHSLSHTSDVLSEVIRFAVVDSLSDREIELLAIAAVCHDMGFIKSPVRNEPIGAAYAREEMTTAGGYTEEEIALVERMILDTALVDTGAGPRQISSTDLSRYLLDADLSNFGRDDFFDKGELQRKELGVDQEIFRRNSFQLLNSHRWLTNAARKLRQGKKEENLSLLKAMVSQKDSSSISFDRLGFLAKLPMLLNSSLDTQKVIRIAVEELTARLHAQAATIFLLDDDGETISFWALQGSASSALVGKKIPAGVGIVGWVIQNQEAIIVNDAASDPRFFSQIDKEGGFNTRSMICAPLSVREQSRVGAVQVLNKEEGVFTREDLEFVVQFSHQVALAIANAQLYEAVSQRTHQLELVDRRKNQLMSLLAAALKDPVNSIGVSAGLLGSGALNDGLMVEKTCLNLNSSVARLSKIISDFRNLALATSSRIVLDRAQCSVAPLLHQAVATFESTVQQRGLSIALECPQNVEACAGDNGLLQVVVSNLIANAIKFTPSSGEITVRASQAEGFITIDVIDTGNGMAPHEILRIFDGLNEEVAIDPSSATYEYNQKGLGLGLPAAQAILHAHGTKLEVRSSSGKGTSVSFSLPVYS